MREAGERLLKLSADEEAQDIARAREESQWAWEHTLHATEERGREEGWVEGLQLGELKKAIEIAKASLKNGLDINTIALITGLDLDVVSQLKFEIENCSKKMENQRKNVDKSGF